MNRLYVLEQTTMIWTTFQGIQGVYLKLFKLIIMPMEEKILLSETWGSTWRLLTPDENLYGNMILFKFQGDSSSLNEWPLFVTTLSSFQSSLNNKLSSVIPYMTWDNTMVASTVTTTYYPKCNHVLFYFNCLHCHITSSSGPHLFFFFNRYTVVTQ